MRIRITFLLAVFAIALVSGCRHHNLGMGEGVKGSGTRQTQKRDVPEFKSIAAEGAFDIEVVCQKDRSVEVEADDNILPLVATEVSSSVLHIRSLRSFSSDRTIRVRITVPNIDAVSLSGAGNLKVTGLRNDKFAISSSGAPNATAEGETKSLRIDASGAGKIDTTKLHASEVVVDAKGAVKVELFASNKLDAVISGPSHVIYEGDPDVNQTINGPGSLEKKETSGT